MKIEQYQQLERDLHNAQNGCLKAKEKIINIYINYVYKLAFSYKIPNHDLDDLVSIGTYTILDCIKKYNSSINNNFTAYVTSSIKNNYNYVLKKASKDYKLINYDNLYSVASNEDAEHRALMGIQVSQLHQALKILTVEEMKLISDIYFYNRSLSQMARDLNISYQVLYKKKKKILNKLHLELKKK